MLKKNNKSSTKKSGGRYAIIASRYNGRYVNSMLRAAKAELAAVGAESIEVVRVLEPMKSRSWLEHWRGGKRSRFPRSFVWGSSCVARPPMPNTSAMR